MADETETDVVEVDETPDVVELEVGDTGLTAAELAAIYGIDARYFNQTIDPEAESKAERQWLASVFGVNSNYIGANDHG